MAGKKGQKKRVSSDEKKVSVCMIPVPANTRPGWRRV